MQPFWSLGWSHLPRPELGAQLDICWILAVFFSSSAFDLWGFSAVKVVKFSKDRSIRLSLIFPHFPKIASAERPGAMHTRARCVRRLCGHPVRSGRFTSSMTRPLGNHAKKRNGTCQNRNRTRNSEAQALVTSALRVAPFGCLSCFGG